MARERLTGAEAGFRIWVEKCTHAQWLERTGAVGAKLFEFGELE